MATAAQPEEGVGMSCSTCLEVEGYLLDPKSLPCQHIVCVRCLEDQKGDGKSVKCSICEKQYLMTIDELPSALVGVDSVCDPCKKKGVQSQTAKVFCTECKRKYCAVHKEAHEDLNEGHKMISIKAYKKSAFSEELHYCEHHKSEPVTIGCKTCWIIICPLCISSSGNCEDGRPHNLMALIELEKEFTQYLEPLKQELEDRFDEFSAIVKESTLSLSHWDIETEQSISTLHKARNEQLKEINAKYAALEDEQRRSRGQGKEQLSEYKEKAGTKLAELHESLKSMRQDISQRHVVDNLNARRSFIKQMSSFMKAKFPGIAIQRQQVLVKSGTESRDVEMKIDAADDIIIAPPGKEHFFLPTSLQLVKQVAVRGPVRVCHYQGCTYVGKWNLDFGQHNFYVDRIDRDGQVTESFIDLPGYPTGIIAHEDRLYILVKGEPYSVHVYDLNGIQLHTWKHVDTLTTSFLHPALTIVDNQLVIAGRTRNIFIMYSLTGTLIRVVNCDLIGQNNVSLCFASDNSILVTNYMIKPHLYKFNLASGVVEWRSDEIPKPAAVTKLSDDYALTCDSDNSKQIKLFIIDTNTGAVVKELKDPEERPKASYVNDIYVDGDTVILPRPDENAVLFYKLKYD